MVNWEGKGGSVELQYKIEGGSRYRRRKWKKEKNVPTGEEQWEKKERDTRERKWENEEVGTEEMKWNMEE